MNKLNHWRRNPMDNNPLHFFLKIFCREDIGYLANVDRAKKYLIKQEKRLRILSVRDPVRANCVFKCIMQRSKLLKMLEIKSEIKSKQDMLRLAPIILKKIEKKGPELQRSIIIKSVSRGKKEISLIDLFLIFLLSFLLSVFILQITDSPHMIEKTLEISAPEIKTKEAG